MMKLIPIIALSVLLIGCPWQDNNPTPSLSNDPSVDPHKGQDFDDRMRSGDITGAINRMVDPPCADCSTGGALPGSQDLAPVQMIAEVSNTNCFSRGSQADLRALNFDLRGANSDERRYMEKFASTIIDIAGESQARALVGDLRVVYQDKLRARTDGNCLPAHQLTAGEVNVARRCPDNSRIRSSEGIVVHEIGHYVANRGGWYPRYEAAVASTCRVSGYCTHTSMNKALSNRNEEFAEVFAAFLTATDRLKQDCPQAYEFFKNEMFNGSEYSCRGLSQPI